MCYSSTSERYLMKFKCKQSQEVYEFLMEHDIKSMLSHPDYEAVVEEEKPAKKSKKEVNEETI